MWRALFVAVIAGWSPIAALADASAPMAWREAFPIESGSSDVHMKARFRGADGRDHTLEVWRAGETFVHRRTDDRLDLYVQADAARAGGYAYRLIDHARRVVIDVDRSNLHRIGVFAEWEALAHVIAPPKSAYTVEALTHDKPGNAAGACEWRRITSMSSSGSSYSDVCWSTQWGMPIHIAAGTQDRREQPAPAAAGDFETINIEPLPDSDKQALRMPPVPGGYDYIDSNADIDPMGD